MFQYFLHTFKMKLKVTHVVLIVTARAQKFLATKLACCSPTRKWAAQFTTGVWFMKGPRKFHGCPSPRLSVTPSFVSLYLYQTLLSSGSLSLSFKRKTLKKMPSDAQSTVLKCWTVGGLHLKVLHLCWIWNFFHFLSEENRPKKTTT